MPAVTNMNNNGTRKGTCSCAALSWVCRLITRPTAQPTINKPPTSSPQRIFFSNMKLESISAKERRGSFPATAPSASGGGQKNLFQPFTQVDGSFSRRYGGTGLGLTISKQLTEIMGGRIGFESKLGQGSSFWFELPLRKQLESGTVEAQQQLMAGLNVLVVDDN